MVAQMGWLSCSEADLETNKHSMTLGDSEDIEMVKTIKITPGRWDWVRAPFKADREPPVGRY